MDIQESEEIIGEICWLGQVLCLLSGELVPSRVRRHHSHCWSYHKVLNPRVSEL